MLLFDFDYIVTVYKLFEQFYKVINLVYFIDIATLKPISKNKHLILPC